MNPTEDLPFAHGTPQLRGSIKLVPEDFIVDEILSFIPSGHGEHALVRIEKWGETTDFITRELQRFTGVRARDIGFAGIKDRHGRTIQWFSIPLPGKPDPDWGQFKGEGYRVIESTRNDRKLRRGALSGNRFQLTLREVQGNWSELENKLETISEHGVPNYFGPQRFGRDGQNVERALNLIRNPDTRISPHLRGLYLSAARSLIFNHILARRVSDQSWNQAISGDVFMFQDSKSFFSADACDPVTLERVRLKEIHPSGPLVGKLPSSAVDDALEHENHVIDTFPELHDGLVRLELESMRRPYRLWPALMSWKHETEDRLHLEFQLPAGSYATTVLREIISFNLNDTIEV